MKLEALKLKLQKDAGLDVDEALRTFSGEEGIDAADSGLVADKLLNWLRKKDKISKSQFVEIHAHEPVHTRTRQTWLGASDPEATRQAEPVIQEEPSRYIKLGEVGKGGMATILVARDGELGRKVAFKEMQPEVALNHRLAMRFYTEAQVTAQLEHPNIVPVYGLEAEDGQVVGYSMKLIHGHTLAEMVDESIRQRKAGGEVDEPFQLSTLLEVFLKVCDAMAYAHDKAVVHRDLKPENIMIGRHGEVYVMDWGLARVLSDAGEDSGAVSLTGTLTDTMEGADPRLTRIGAILGTPSFMSPEQAMGEPDRVGPKSDQYSLGLILFELACGLPGREGGDVIEVLSEAREGAIRKIQAYGVEPLSPDLAAIIKRALHPRANQRYPSVDDFADDLRRYRDNEPVKARPDTALRAAMRWLSRNREKTLSLVASLLMAVFVVVGLAVVAVVTKSSRDAQRAAAEQQALGELLADVSRAGGAIDRHFGSLEGRVEAIAGTARALLKEGAPEPVRYHVPADFAVPERAPPDLGPALMHREPVSTRWPDMFLVPGMTPEARDDLHRRIHPIRHELRRAQIMTRITADPDVNDEAEAEAAWRGRPGPMRWASVGLSQGMLVELPGHHWTPKNYDPRIRPWFTLGIGRRAPTWGNPYQEANRSTLQIPCSMGIYDGDEMLGIATVSTEFSYLQERFMKVSHPAVDRVLLLDPEGGVVLRSGQQTRITSTHDALNKVHETPKYRHPELLSELQNDKAGYQRFEEEGRDVLVVYYGLHMPGWSLVVEADADRLYGR